MFFSDIYNRCTVNQVKNILFGKKEESSSFKTSLQISECVQNQQQTVDSQSYKSRVITSVKSGFKSLIPYLVVNYFPQLTVASSLTSLAITASQTTDPQEKKYLKIKGAILVGSIATSALLSCVISNGSFKKPIFDLLMQQIGYMAFCIDAIPAKAILGTQNRGIKDSILSRIAQQQLVSLSLKGTSYLIGAPNHFLVNTILPSAIESYVFYMNPFVQEDKIKINYQDAGELLKECLPSSAFSRMLPSALFHIPLFKQSINDILEMGIEQKRAMNLIARLLEDYSLLLHTPLIQEKFEQIKNTPLSHRQAQCDELSRLIEGDIASKSKWYDQFLWNQVKEKVPCITPQYVDECLQAISPHFIYFKWLIDPDINAICLNSFICFIACQIRDKAFNKSYLSPLQESEITNFYKNISSLFFMKTKMGFILDKAIGPMLKITKNLVFKEVSRALDLQKMSRDPEVLPLESTMRSSPTISFLRQMINFMGTVKQDIVAKSGEGSLKIQTLFSKSAGLVRAINSELLILLARQEGAIFNSFNSSWMRTI
ncbi:MAG: hypothetical protein QRY72_05570 [Candidatus Rhabdochlamydia sp.]